LLHFQKSSAMRACNRITALALIVITGGCTSRLSRAGIQYPAPSTRAWHDAVNLLQTDDTAGVLLDSLLVVDVAAGLARIRVAYPETSAMEVGPDRTYLVITLDSATSVEITQRANNDYSQRTLVAAYQSSSIAATLDSMAHPLGVLRRELRVQHPTWLEIRLYFRRPVDVWPLAWKYRRLPHVRFAGPEMYLGDGDGIGLEIQDPPLRFFFVQKWGDCPAGCLHWHATPITYDRRTGKTHREPGVGDPYPTEPHG
jgi:hypothetical protein